MEIGKWLIDWFEKNSHMEKNEIEKNISKDYLSSGWIDSLKFITFISDIEKHFSVIFSNDEFQDKSFATIEGLTKIIQRKIK